MKLRNRHATGAVDELTDLNDFDLDEPVAVRRPPNSALLTIGRAIFGGYFLYNGIKHFRQLENYSGYAGSKGVPAPKAAVAVSGALLVAGGASLLTGVKPKIGAALIETFLIGVSPAMHAYWKEEGGSRQADEINFLKNMALAGAGLLAAAIPEPWPVSLGRSGAAAL